MNKQYWLGFFSGIGVYLVFTQLFGSVFTR